MTASTGVGRACLAAACALTIFFPATARGIDRVTVTYGVREYAEFNDNLFNTSEGDEETDKIDDIAINTAPDVSILYDDGETRWLARGSYRRESFLDNKDASGNYWAASGEFSRALSHRVTFALLGSYTNFASLELGRTLGEPGQRAVFRPLRGVQTTGTFFSPSLTVFWSRRFRTTLGYEDNQSFVSGSINSINRSVSLNTVYGLTPKTTLKGFLLGTANRNSGVAFIDRQDVNSVVARFGFAHVFSPRFTVDVSAGPQWTKDINLPDKVTLLRNALVKEIVDPRLGLTEQVFLREPGKEVDDLSLGLSLNLQVSYQLDHDTALGLLLSQGTTSGEGASGTQENREAQVTISRNLNSKWTASVRAALTERNNVPNEFAILLSKNRKTGETQALDRETFDLDDRFEQREMTFEPRLTYRINPWTSAYASWNWTELKQESLGDRSRVNRVQVGIEFRRDAYY